MFHLVDRRNGLGSSTSVLTMRCLCAVLCFKYQACVPIVPVYLRHVILLSSDPSPMFSLSLSTNHGLSFPQLGAIPCCTRILLQYVHLHHAQSRHIFSWIILLGTHFWGPVRALL